MKALLKKLYPEEIIAISAVCLMAIVFWFLPQPLRWADPLLIKSLIMRLLMPMLIYLAALLLWRAARIRQHDQLGQLFWESLEHSVRLWVVFYLALIVHFNIKINVGVWRKTLYDPGLLAIDRWLEQWISWLSAWHAWVVRFYDLTLLYGFVFEAMFLLSFIVLRLGQSERRFREMFAAIILVNLLGSLGYIVWPALGPFIADTPTSPHMQAVFSSMYTKYYTYVSSAGLNYTPTFLTQGLAAMPSLHMGNAAVFTYFIWRNKPRWLWLYILICAFIAVEALYSRFHYFVDLIVGVEIAAIAIIVAQWLYVWYDRARPHRHATTTHSA